MPESQGRVQDAFWDLELVTLDDSTVHLSDFRGAYVLLNFWGEWCTPCLEEMPMLVEAHERIAPERFTIVGMLLSYDEARAQSVIDEAGASWPQALIDETMAQQFGILAYPMNVLIMPDGVTYEKRYLIDRSFIEQYVER